MFKVIGLVAMAAMVITACSPLNKMKKNATDIKYNVTPDVLEAHANMVDVKILFNIPAKYFNKNVIVEATPVIHYTGGEKAFKTRILQGEKVQENNTVVPYKVGKTITYTGKIAYDKVMRISDLEIRLKGRKGNKVVDFAPIKIADGVIATSTLVQNKPIVIIGKDAFQRIISEDKTADIHYMINSSSVRWTEKKGEDIKALQEFVKNAKTDERKELKGFKIKAYASPDGKEDFNEKLATRRGITSKNFVKKQMRKIDEFKVEDFFSSQITAEDWDGFKKLMEDSDIQDKELILRVLSMYNDPEIREREIKNISAIFKQVAKDVLPKLRRSQLVMTIDNIGYSDDELKYLIENNPRELNIEELLYSATLFNENSDKMAIYEMAKKQFSSDWRGYNDVAVILFNTGNIPEASKNLDIANRLSANNKVVKNNLGAIELVKGNVDLAEVLFGAASGVGMEVNYNNGIVAIMNADYDRAMNYFESCNSANSALACILAGNNNLALQKLNASKNNSAMVLYLKAVVGARTNNEGLIFNNLRIAIAKDASLKSVAKTDMEFAKYFENANFKSIVD